MKSGASIREVVVATALVGTISMVGTAKLTTMTTASEVASARASMATLRAGLLSYQSDQGGFPFCNSGGDSFASALSGNVRVLERLTTPIAYVAPSDFVDPFVPETRRSAPSANAIVSATPVSVSPPMGHPFTYQSFNTVQRTVIGDSTSPATAFVLQSAGPDLNFYNLGGVIANDLGTAANTINLLYDPTNGTVSQGSLFISGGMSNGAGSGLLLAIEAAAGTTGMGDSFIVY